MSDSPDDWKPRDAIAKLSASLEQPDKFAEIFCAAAKKQKDIDDILRANTKYLIQHDNETRAYLKEIFREIEREDWRLYVKKLGSGGLVLASTVFGIVITIVIQKLMGVAG